MADEIAALMSIIFTCFVLGCWGMRMAKAKNFNPWYGFALGAFVPLAGIGILVMLNKRRP
ncbi:MAG: hypothetical protein ABI643_03590 [Candidatus Doudnabacteria bacterium]